jgi:hypothetical protein
MGEYALIQSWTWTTGTSTQNNPFLYGIPFTLQSPVLAQRISASTASPSVTYDYIFAIYDDRGVLQAQTLAYGLSSGNPRPGGGALSNVTAGLFPLTSATTLMAGNYYLSFIAYMGVGTGGTGLNAASTSTPIQTNVALGVKEADVAWNPGTSTSLPSTVTWRTPTITQCALVQIQGIGVSI